MSIILVPVLYTYPTHVYCPFSTWRKVERYFNLEQHSVTVFCLCGVGRIPSSWPPKLQVFWTSARCFGRPDADKWVGEVSTYPQGGWTMPRIMRSDCDLQGSYCSWYTRKQRDQQNGSLPLSLFARMPRIANWVEPPKCTVTRSIQKRCCRCI